MFAPERYLDTVVLPPFTVIHEEAGGASALAPASPAIAGPAMAGPGWDTALRKFSPVRSIPPLISAINARAAAAQRTGRTWKRLARMERKLLRAATPRRNWRAMRASNSVSGFNSVNVLPIILLMVF